MNHPEHSDEKEARRVHDQRGGDLLQPCHPMALGDPQSQHQQGQDDGEDAVAGAVLAASAGGAMAAGSDLSRMGGSALAAAIRSKKASARDAMAACLDQIEAVNPAINAVVSMPPREALMAQAAAADERQAR